MIPFERQFQTLHSLQNYFLLNELLAPGLPMPIVDTEPLRQARAGFVARFCERPYYFVRAATPQVLMDEVDQVALRRGRSRCSPSPTPGRPRWPRRSPCSHEHGPEARLLAGGTDLVIGLRDGDDPPDRRHRPQAGRRAATRRSASATGAWRSAPRRS